MAITTVQGARDGMVPPANFIKPSTTCITGRPATNWYQAGIPAAAAVAAPGVAGAALTSPVTGQLAATYPGGVDNIIAHAVSATVATNAQLWVVDRLWHNSGVSVTVTTAQTVGSVTWPARDVNASTNGEGVYIAVEVSGATGAGTPTLTMTYTNSAGTGGRVATSIYATAASSAQGVWYIMGLQAGDTGVRSVQDFTLSVSWTSGTIALVAFRPILITSGGSTSAAGVNPISRSKLVADAVTACAPRVWDNSVLQVLGVGTTTSFQAIGRVTLSQG